MTSVPLRDYTQGRDLKHIRIREYVRSLLTGSSPGTPAPSERELVHQFGVARTTARQALDGLVVEGLLERVPGRGTFVARPRRVASGVSGLSEELQRRGIICDSQTLMARRELAPTSVAQALGIAAGDRIIHWRRLRRASGRPFCVEDAFINELFVPNFLQRPSYPSSLYRDLAARGHRPTWVEDTFTADLPTPEETDLLHAEQVSAVIRQRRRALTADRAVMIARTVYRGDLYTVRIQLGQES